MKKQITLISCILAFTLVLTIFFINQEEFQEGGQEITGNIILSLNDVNYPEFNDIEVELYYKEKECLRKQEEVLSKYNEVIIRSKKSINRISQERKDYLTSLGITNEYSVLIFSDTVANHKLVVSGDLACSEELINYNLCNLIEEDPNKCISPSTIDKKIGKSEIIESDSVCYKCCDILYQDGDNIVFRNICGPTCGFVSDYVNGESTTIFRNCMDKGCKTDIDDMACCMKDKCVNKGICYNTLDIVDVGDDGKREICIVDENEYYVWADPDKNENICKGNNLRWVQSQSSTSPISSLFSLFIQSKEGFCCGDDKEEYPIRCNGFICSTAKNNDFSCCKTDQCSYNGKCYPSGCNELKINESRQNLYCDGRTGEWKDLDEMHCAECLGEDSWTDYLCCGDDHGEGRYAKNFVYHLDENVITDKSMCTNRRSDCIYPSFEEPFKEGCYSFEEKYDYLRGSYYCSNSIWYDPDIDRRYCLKCSLDWTDTNNCCGDDDYEYFIKGTDGTEACCDSSSYCVVGGECTKCETCGNEIIEKSEQCESPHTQNNSYCNQTSIMCLDNKLGIRDNYGNCNEWCSCTYDNFNYSCIKGQCGAECNEDGTGCKEGQICSTASCSCYDAPEDNVTEIKDNKINCPYIVDILFDKEEYFVGDNANITIKVFDENMNTMPSVKFFLESYIDGEIKDMSLYSTERDGNYRITKFITNSTTSGNYMYIAKVYFMNCEVIVDSSEAIFTIPKKHTVATTNILKNTEPLKERTVNLTEFNPPLLLTGGICGDGILNIGEVCEGSGICKNSLGCNYIDHTYDSPDLCENCECSYGRKSKPNEGEYCDNCEHCGDGTVNCGEECETGSNKEIVCKEDNIYEVTYFCSDCKWNIDATYDSMIEGCWCDCPSETEENCVDGNYISYTKDYNPGCSGEECNMCSCQDVYTKDSNNDGIEDKCSPEICNNNFDDNDNGIVDEKECEWIHCSDCGHGTFNLCDKEECLSYEEGCFFENSLFNYGFCSTCSLLKSCEDYIYHKDNCILDSCNIGNCYWNSESCCTDSDKDSVCDYVDNCKNLFNPKQIDSDNNSIGDECDVYEYWPNIYAPIEKNESICYNDTAENCSYMLDYNFSECNSSCLDNLTGLMNRSSKNKDNYSETK